MKPIAPTTPKSTHREAFDRAVSNRRRSPLTDYSYHSGGFEDSSAHCTPVRVQSLWNISGDYFKHEAAHDFRSEAALFAIITITAALPLINNLHALIEFARAITSQ